MARASLSLQLKTLRVFKDVDESDTILPYTHSIARQDIPRGAIHTFE